VPEAAISAASLFEPFWRGDSPEIEAPDDAPPEAVAVID
jgi:hypothetical protein